VCGRLDSALSRLHRTWLPVSACIFFVEFLCTFYVILRLMYDTKRRQKGRKGLIFYWKCSLLLLITVLYLVQQLILYSHSVWVINTACSLFIYFTKILFAAYTVNRQILVRFSWKFLTFFNTVSIKSLFQSCISVKKTSSDKFARWHHRSVCCLFSL